MNKEVAPKGKNEVAGYQPALGLLSQAPTLSSEHLRLSKLKIHQGTTTGRQGMIGEIFSTPDLQKIAAPGEKVVFYPITYKLSWYHNKKAPNEQKPSPIGITQWKSASQFEWKRQDPDGTIFQNFQTVTFFVLLESDLKKGMMTPHQIVLSSTNFTAAGLPLMNRYDELKRHKVEPWLMKFALSSEQSKKGAWQVFKIEPVSDKNGQVRAEENVWEPLRRWTSTLLEMQTKGALEQTADDLAADVEESTERPLTDAELQF